MRDLAGFLKGALAPFAVNPDNVFTRSWNHSGSDDPFRAPDIGDLKDQVEPGFQVTLL